jgi:carbamoyltransferase
MRALRSDAAESPVRVLGISGLGNALSFKRSEWPGMDEREYGICPGQDAAAALVVNGHLAAAVSEECFSHKRHSGEFPIHSIRFCLSQQNLRSQDIDLLVHSYDFSVYQDLYLRSRSQAELYRKVFSRNAVLKQVRRYLPGVPIERVQQISHHLAHAANAYHTSGWKDCVVVVMDGLGGVRGVTAYHARRKGFEEMQEIFAANSIGIFLGLVAMQLGFNFRGDQDQVIHLARDGDAARFRSFFEQAVKLGRDGAILIPPLWLNKTQPEREFYLGTRRYLTDYLGPPRLPKDEIVQRHRDIAAGLEECLKRAVLHICSHLRAVTGLPRIALAGDVALNFEMNGHLLRSGMFSEVFIPPAPGDEGTAVGAALLGAWTRRETTEPGRRLPFFGPSHVHNEIIEACRRSAGKVRVRSLLNLAGSCRQAANLIAQGKSVAWYHGRMEFGPTALGHRNIIAIPGAPQVENWLRDAGLSSGLFRPVGTAVLAEEVHLVTDLPVGTDLPYMNVTALIRGRFATGLSAITNSEGMVRLQTVSRKDNPEFHCLLNEVKKLTGCPILMTTSFRTQSDPIVDTPQQALDAFLNTEIDYLFLENHLVWRATDPSDPFNSAQ